MSSDSEELEFKKSNTTDKPKEIEFNLLKSNALKTQKTGENAREKSPPLIQKNDDGDSGAKNSKTITLEDEI
jgi:hypothetical protein